MVNEFNHFRKYNNKFQVDLELTEKGSSVAVPCPHKGDGSSCLQKKTAEFDYIQI